jgi:hypothetical protein
MIDRQAKAATMQQRLMTFAQARKILCKELNRDEGLRQAYRAMIACTLYDLAREGSTHYEAMPNCSTMAERLLNALFTEEPG